MKDRVGDPRLIVLILIQFNSDSFTPSLGVNQLAVEQGYDAVSVRETLTVMSSPHKVIKDRAGVPVADDRLVERKGKNKGASYRLTPYGVQELARLRGILEKADG